MPAGIAQQIDELDQLLDKLLHLPIEQATAAPAVLPLQPIAEVLEHPSTKPILRFTQGLPGLALHHEASSPSLDLLGDEDDQPAPPAPSEPALLLHPGSDSELESVDASLTTSKPHLATAQPTDDHSPTEPLLSLKQERSISTAPARVKLPTEEIPWIDDEPLPIAKGGGPKVEIIQGSSSQIIYASEQHDPVPVIQPRKRSWLFWILWTWTWLFDHTIGRWFPLFRRPTVKLILGLLGVALFAVSIYVTWKGL